MARIARYWLPSSLIMLIFITPTEGIQNITETSVTNVLCDGYSADVSCDHRKRLVSDVFGNDKAFARPYCGNDTTINVTLDIALRQLMKLDEPNQILKVYVWIRLSWYDCNLVWNASDYGGIDSIAVPFEAIWIPDITLHDSAAQTLYGYREFRPTVYSNGDVFYNFPSIIESQCNVDVRLFPVDIQKCNLTFGSWAYHGLQVDFRPKYHYGDLTSVQISTTWDFMRFSAEKHVKYYRCCPEPYPEVLFQLEIQRKPLFYVVNIIIPTFLVTLIAVLAFILPVESGEKVGLSVTIMLALSVFQLLVSDSMPPSAESTPLIALYFDFMLFLCGFSCAVATFTISLYFKDDKMSNRIRNILLRPLAKIAFVKIPDNNEDVDISQQTDEISSAPELDDSRDQKINEKSSIFLSDITVTTTDGADDITAEWKLLSVAVDRICLVLYTLIFAAGTSAMIALFNI